MKIQVPEQMKSPYFWMALVILAGLVLVPMWWGRLILVLAYMAIGGLWAAEDEGED